MSPVSIRAYQVQDLERILELIVSIQQQEFGIAISAEDQPDLAAIPSFYQSGCGGFWVAAQSGSIVGTIGLRDIGNRQCALRKMFVAPHARGREQGVAVQLLDTLLCHAETNKITDIFLGTAEAFVAAHRFYEKYGFIETGRDQLPTSFPLMSVDSKFYRRQISRSSA